MKVPLIKAGPETSRREISRRSRSEGMRFAPVADLLELSAICWNNQVDWIFISHPILDSVVKTHYLC